ncbi:methyltransferase domain-containing protein [Candidatus Kaiserbacteria bacterium]|nr:methyltransferase domain-containing protein [Candidatus Kaiserbacteria bacterium]
MNIPLTPVIDFGRMPIANAFLTPEEFSNEYFYDMVVGYDPATHAIGLVNTVPPEKMFHENYAFFSSTSKGMQNHFRETAEKLKPIAGEGIVVEVGSNDGIMLQAWKDMGVRAVGVEPSANVAQVSLDKGHDVIVKFMSPEVVDEILARGNVSLVFGANVSCHIERFVEYLEYVTKLIGKNGVFVFEDPYFLDIVEKTSYDQVYDEHLWYFTVSFINALLSPMGFHVFDCEHVPVHGGELRMYVGHQDTHPATPAVDEWLAKETDLPGKLQTLKSNIAISKTKLVELLSQAKKEGKRICGFGASSKGTIVTNFCGIGSELVPFITDNTPAKQGKFYPGVHIPIRPQEEFKDIDVAVLFAWNHLVEINKLPLIQPFRNAGGKWLTHVPMPHFE